MLQTRIRLISVHYIGQDEILCLFANCGCQRKHINEEHMEDRVTRGAAERPEFNRRCGLPEEAGLHSTHRKLPSTNLRICLLDHRTVGKVLTCLTSPEVQVDAARSLQ